MNISNKSNIQIDENISVRSNKIDFLNNNLSSSYCPSISFSYEVNNELKTDLYGKENAEARKFNELNVPEYIKDYSKKFVDILFLNEINKRRKTKFSLRLSNIANNGRNQSKFYAFFDNLSKSVDKRKSEFDIKSNFPAEEDNKSLINSYYNLLNNNNNINFKENKNENNFNFNCFPENENLNINLNDLPEIKNEFANNIDDSFNKDFNDMIHKSFASKSNNIIEKFMQQNSNENSNLGEFKNMEEFFVEKENEFVGNNNENFNDKIDLGFNPEEDFEKKLFAKEFEKEIELLDNNNKKNYEKEKAENEKFNNLYKFTTTVNATTKEKNLHQNKIKSNYFNEDKLLGEHFPNSFSLEKDEFNLQENENEELNEHSSFINNKNIKNTNNYLNSKDFSESKNVFFESAEAEENKEEQENDDLVNSVEQNSASAVSAKEGQEDFEKTELQMVNEIFVDPQEENNLNSTSSYEIKEKDDLLIKEGKEPLKLEFVKKLKKERDVHKKDKDANVNINVNNKHKKFDRDVKENKNADYKVEKNKENIKAKKKEYKNNVADPMKAAKDSKRPESKNKNLGNNFLHELKNEEEAKAEIKKHVNKNRASSKENFLVSKSKEKLKIQNKINHDNLKNKKEINEKTPKESKMLIGESKKEKAIDKNKFINDDIDSNNNKIKKLKNTQSKEKHINNNSIVNNNNDNPKRKTFTVERSKKRKKNLNEKTDKKQIKKSADFKRILIDSNEKEISQSFEAEEKLNLVEKNKKATKQLNNNAAFIITNKKNTNTDNQFKSDLLMEKLNKKSKEKQNLAEANKTENYNNVNNINNNNNYNVKITKALKSPDNLRESKSISKTQQTKNILSIKIIEKEKLLTPNAKTNFKLKSENDDSDLELSDLSEITRDKLINKRIRANKQKSASKKKSELSSNLSVSANKRNKQDLNNLKKTSNTTSYFFETKNANSPLINKKSSNNKYNDINFNIKNYSKTPGRQINSENDNNEATLSENKKLSKLLEIKRQIAKTKELNSTNNNLINNNNNNHNLNKENNSNKKLSVNFAAKKSNSLKKKNSISGVKSDLESKSESTNNGVPNANKRYSNVISAINNPMSLNDEIEFIFKKIKVFKDSIFSNNKENNNNNVQVNVKDKENLKTDLRPAASFKANIKEFNSNNIISDLENNFNLNLNYKEAEKNNFDLIPKLTTIQKIDQIKKNFIKQFIKKKTLTNDNSDKKDNIDFKEEFKQIHNNNFINNTNKIPNEPNNNINKVKTFINNNNENLNTNNNVNTNLQKKATNDLLLQARDDNKNVIPNINSNLFKQQQQSQNAFAFSSNSRNIESIVKNKFDKPINFGNVSTSDKNFIKSNNNNNNNIYNQTNKENLNKINIENSNVCITNNLNIVNFPDLKVNYVNNENSIKANAEMLEKVLKNKVQSQTKDLIKVPKLEVNLASENKNSKTPRTNNNNNASNVKINIDYQPSAIKEKVNEIKYIFNNINNPKDVGKMQVFQDLIKKYNDIKVTKENSIAKDEKIRSIKKIGSLNIMLKKDTNLISNNIARKPSTANIAAKKNNFILRVASPLDKNTNSFPYNDINIYTNNYLPDANKTPNQSEQHNLHIFQETNIKAKNEFINTNNNNNLLKMPVLNKDSLINLNNTNFNNSNRKEEILNHSENQNNVVQKQEENFNNLIVNKQIDHKGKMLYNPIMANKNKFEKIYQNYKEQEKSLKEFIKGGNHEVEAKAYFANNETNKVHNVNIRVINS